MHGTPWRCFPVWLCLTVSIALAGDPPPATGPFTADYDTGLVNSWGGTTAAFYGGGDPFFQSDWMITVGTAGGALSVTNPALPNNPDYTFFGATIEIDSDTVDGINLLHGGVSPADLTLTFDIALTSTTAHGDWGLRFSERMR